MLYLNPGKPYLLGLRECPKATAPQLKASCPLQYEAIMDRVQKSKLSLYKKAMEVGARLLGCEGCRAQGMDPRRPGMGTWDRACLRSSSSNMRVLGAALGAKAPHRSAQALPIRDS